MSYSTAMGRWLTQDPLGYVGGQNLYQMEASSPESSIDPSGMLQNVVVGTNRYGTWLISANAQNRSVRDGRRDAGAGVAITFKPSNACRCREIAYVQLIRVTYADSGEIKPIFPHRQTSNGWAVDRAGPFVLGWFGYDNPDAGHPDGVPTPTIIPGVSPATPPQPAILTDTPHSPDPVALVFNFQTYAICKGAGPDHGVNYGGISWDVSIDKSGRVTIPDAWLMPTSKDFAQAVDAWNREVPAPGDPQHRPLGPFI